MDVRQQIAHIKDLKREVREVSISLDTYGNQLRELGKEFAYKKRIISSIEAGKLSFAKLQLAGMQKVLNREQEKLKVEGIRLKGKARDFEVEIKKTSEIRTTLAGEDSRLKSEKRGLEEERQRLNTVRVLIEKDEEKLGDGFKDLSLFMEKIENRQKEIDVEAQKQKQFKDKLNKDRATLKEKDVARAKLRKGLLDRKKALLKEKELLGTTREILKKEEKKLSRREGTLRRKTQVLDVKEKNIIKREKDVKELVKEIRRKRKK